MCRWFASTDIVLFLNKVDLFEKKIQHVDIRQELPDGTVLFGDYRGGLDRDAGLKYILDRFLERNENPNKSIYYRFTSATDKGSVEHVFRSVQSILLRTTLKGAGFDEDEAT